MHSYEASASKKPGGGFEVEQRISMNDRTIIYILSLVVVLVLFWVAWFSSGGPDLNEDPWYWRTQPDYETGRPR